MWTRRTLLKGLAGAGMVVSLPWPARAQAPIRIGHQADLTGVASIFGFWNDRAAQAAVDKLNAEGGINGRRVELITEDTGSNANTGVRAFRSLALRNEVDFALGTILAEVNKPSAPLAQEFGVPYFPSDDVPVQPGAPEVNRYTFRLGHNTRVKAQVSHRWALDNLGTRWTFLSSDGAWGRAQVEDFSRLIQPLGGQVLDIVFGPIGTQDFIPLLARVDVERTDVLYHTFFGSDAVSFYAQALELGLLERVAVFASVGTIEGLGLDVLGGTAEGASFVTEFPRRLDQIPEDLRGFNAEIRRLVGIDEEGNQSDGPNVVTAEHFWVPWVNLHVIKAGIEASGWRAKADTPAFIEALEGMSFKASLDFPSGDFFIRPADHRAFRDYFIERVQGDRLLVAEHFPKALGLYDPPVDVTQLGF